MVKPLIKLLAVCAASWPLLAIADSGECYADAATNATNAVFERYVRNVEAIEKSGRLSEALEQSHKTEGCPFSNSPYWPRLDGVRYRTSLRLGEAAEQKGALEDALEYFSKYYHDIPTDRVQYKLAIAKPDTFQVISDTTYRFRRLRDDLRKENDPRFKDRSHEQLKADAREGFVSAETASRAAPDRAKRVAALDDYLKKLEAIIRDNSEKLLAAEEKSFAGSRRSFAGGDSGVQALDRAKSWLTVIGQEKKADQRAVQRGNELLKDDSRKSLELAIAYFGIDRSSSERNVRKVQEKARRLGEANLAKGEKEIAADYFSIAGLGDKSLAIREKSEADSAKAEVKRQKQFKKDQKDLEKELGL